MGVVFNAYAMKCTISFYTHIGTRGISHWQSCFLKNEKPALRFFNVRRKGISPSLYPHLHGIQGYQFFRNIKSSKRLLAETRLSLCEHDFSSTRSAYEGNKSACREESWRTFLMVQNHAIVNGYRNTDRFAHQEINTCHIAIWHSTQHSGFGWYYKLSGRNGRNASNLPRNFRLVVFTVFLSFWKVLDAKSMMLKAWCEKHGGYCSVADFSPLATEKSLHQSSEAFTVSLAFQR